MNLPVFIGRLFNKAMRISSAKSAHRTLTTFLGIYEDVSLGQPEIVDVCAPPYPAYWADDEESWNEDENVLWDEGQYRSKMPTDVKVLWGPGSLGVWSRLSASDHDLDDSDDSIGSVFIVEKDGIISKVGFCIRYFNGAPPDYKVSLETVDAAGNPSGTDYGGSAPGEFTPAGAGWLWVSLGTPATAVAGDIIAAVVRPGAVPPTATDSIDVLVSYFGGNLVLPRQIYYSTSWTHQEGIPGIAVQYSDDSVSCLGITSCEGESFDSTDTPDEVGCKFTVPANMVCFGARVAFNTVSSSAPYDVRLYNAADSLIASVSIDDEDKSIRGGSGAHDAFWDEVTLIADATYRITICATSETLSVRPARLTFPDSNAKAWIPEGTRWSGTERTDGGAWTDEALEVGYMALWINSITL